MNGKVGYVKTDMVIGISPAISFGSRKTPAGYGIVDTIVGKQAAADCGDRTICSIVTPGAIVAVSVIVRADPGNHIAIKVAEINTYIAMTVEVLITPGTGASGGDAVLYASKKYQSSGSGKIPAAGEVAVGICRKVSAVVAAP